MDRHTGRLDHHRRARVDVPVHRPIHGGCEQELRLGGRGILANPGVATSLWRVVPSHQYQRLSIARPESQFRGQRYKHVNGATFIDLLAGWWQNPAGWRRPALDAVLDAEFRTNHDIQRR